MSLKNYRIELIEPDLKEFAAHEKAIRALLPTRKEHCVSFDLHDVDVSVANAFRRTVIQELELKSLMFDPTTVQTNVDYILMGEFLDRVQMIPIKQDIPDDLVMSINAMNTSNDNGIVALYSDAITGGEKYIPGRFRIAELRPGNYLKVPKIVVQKGYGYDNACFSLTADFEYNNLDFMDVWIVNSKGNRIKKRVRVDAVAKLAGKKAEAVWDKRILVIPNPAYQRVMSDEVKEKIALANYEITLINTKEPEHDDDYIAEQSSLTAESREFRMSYYLFDQIKPETFVDRVLQNIITRLTAVKTGLEQIYSIEGGGKKKAPEQTHELAHDPTGKIEVRITPIMARHGTEQIAVDLWNLVIKGETHTIGELLVNHINAIDPDIPFVSPKMEHLRDNQITIQVIHPTPEKITLDAIKKCIQVFESLAKQALK